MKQYTVKANNITTQYGLTLYAGEVVSEDKFGAHIKELLDQRAIEEYVEPKAAKLKKDETV